MRPRANMILMRLILAVVSLCVAPRIVHAGPAAPSAPSQVVNFSEARVEFPDVEVVDQFSKSRPIRTILGESDLVVLNFNYSTCHSICPVGNQIMRGLHARIREQRVSRVRLVSITINPTYDTPARMKKLAAQFGADQSWLWLTSTPAAIGDIAKRVGLQIGDLEAHEPLFLIGSPASGRFFRSVSMPSPTQLMSLIDTFAP